MRDRDQRCVITGRSAVIDGVAWWDGFEVAHVFPLAYEQCSQASRPDARALGSYSPVRPGQGGYGRPGTASVFCKQRRTVG